MGSFLLKMLHTGYFLFVLQGCTLPTAKLYLELVGVYIYCSKILNISRRRNIYFRFWKVCICFRDLKLFFLVFQVPKRWGIVGFYHRPRIYVSYCDPPCPTNSRFCCTAGVQHDICTSAHSYISVHVPRTPQDWVEAL